MVVAEIVRTCSHEQVAKAAVASIGREFSSRVDVAAGMRGVDLGAFAAQAVRNFDRRAGTLQRRELERAVRHDDMPLLRALRLILEEEMDQSTH